MDFILLLLLLILAVLNLKEKLLFTPLLKKTAYGHIGNPEATAGVHQNANWWRGDLTNDWPSRLRAMSFRRRYCVAAEEASEITVKTVGCRHGAPL